ncbi:hypothetical protein I6H91_07755 [Micrococcus luteus]|uniref:hypothetical protein n=1 Tax=Micrococcus luteus TaxID=1270 RepID=UPI00190FD67D|nr:hypothetical protein [Micrococcus luteus]QQE48068.1 hypothetical protein I6H91_07755 [Micrococcus luteus]UTX35583.1 hypothetical protein NNL26_04980 [Micrococcus luteus]
MRELRRYLRDYAVDAYSSLSGMRLKMWIADEARNVWGAVYLWDRPEDFSGLFQVSRANDIIGYGPTTVGGFTLEAVAEGLSAFPVLAEVGLAFESLDDNDNSQS